VNDLYPDGTPGWSGGFLKRCLKVKSLTFLQRIKRWIRLVRKIKFAFIGVLMLASCTTSKQRWEIQNQLDLQTSGESKVIQKHTQTFNDISVINDLDRIYKEIEETKKHGK